MATITPRISKKGIKSYKVRAQIAGVKPRYKTFKIKAQAVQWGRETELEMTTLRDKGISDFKLSKILALYENEYSDSSSRPEYEKARIKLFRDSPLGNVKASELQPLHIINWIKERAKKVTGATIDRNLSTLSNAIVFANAELNARINIDVIKSAKKHCNQRKIIAKSQARAIRVTDKQLESILQHSQSEGLSDYAIFAIETAMRRGEIVKLEWSMFTEVQGNYVLNLPAGITKTGKARTVPLTPKALKILNKFTKSDGLVFTSFNRSDGISLAFRRASKRAKLSHIRFHDLRHEATSRLFELGLSTEQVMSITGHEDYRSIARYTHLSDVSVAEALSNALGIRHD